MKYDSELERDGVIHIFIYLFHDRQTFLRRWIVNSYLKNAKLNFALK